MFRKKILPPSSGLKGCRLMDGLDYVYVQVARKVIIGPSEENEELKPNLDQSKRWVENGLF
jgi:hypothetical protein